MKIDVIIPAYNEEKGVINVLSELDYELVREAVVVDNGSTDSTAEVAKKAGATVLKTPIKGYGRACLEGISYVSNKNQPPDIILFMDADYSDFPSEAHRVVSPIIHEGYDMVIGSRALGKRERGSMTPQQVFGNKLATFLLKILYGIQFTDLGPFRAIRLDKLISLGMKDQNYGWTVEMQLKAAKVGLKCMEVPVNYRKRIGKSKVSGTIKGTIMAGYKILFTIFKYL